MLTLFAGDLRHCQLLAIWGLIVLGVSGHPLVAQQLETDIARLAPEACTLMIASTGEIKAEPDGAAIERWLSQPEIIDACDAVFEMLNTQAESGPKTEIQFQKLSVNLVKVSLSQPWILTMERFDLQSIPPLQLALQLDDQQDEIQNKLSQIADENPDHYRRFSIGENTFFSRRQHVIADEYMAIEMGVYRGFFVLATGEGKLVKFLSRFDTPQPQWVNDIREELPIQRLGGLFRLDLKKLIDLVPEEDRNEIPTELHLDQFEEIVGTVGLEEDETVTRIAVHCPGELKGILKIFDTKPIQLNDLKSISESVHVISAARFSPNRFLQLLRSIDEAGEELDEMATDLKEEFGIDFEQDLINSIDDFFYSYQKLEMMNPASSGLASFRVRNPEILTVRLQEIVEQINDGDGAFTIEVEDTKFGKVYSLKRHDMPPGLMMQPVPSFTLFDNELLVALDAGAISSHVRKSQRETGKMIGVERFSALFDNERNGGLGQPLMINYVDMKSIIEMVYSFAAMFAQGPLGNGEFGMDALPPLEVVTNGIEADVSGVYRTKQGFEIWERSTLPGMSALIPVWTGMMVPAVMQVRGAARRSTSINNIRQLLLSNLIYEENHKAFPAVCSMDANRKKLLSWRVHILPYLEQQALYEKFHLDEPWDSPHNKALIKEMPEVFAHPNLKLKPGKTVFLGVAGKNGVFAAPRENAQQQKSPVGMRLQDILDGTSNTAMIVEVNQKAAVTWTAPEDFDIDQFDDPSEVLGKVWNRNSFIVGLCDGSVHTLEMNDDIFETFKKMVTVSGGEVIENFP